MDNNIKCGCKGIRTCLLCEKENFSANPTDFSEMCEETLVYVYCPYCNLCWPGENSTTITYPLYLGKIMLIPDFINETEEERLASLIDHISWMPSQSGRRKQDFGPKVNFKKKKLKVGDFKGFPDFAKHIIQKLQSKEELKDFMPVELCHLEYTPDRGSAIDPHIDDVWLWGDRLVTINLLSHTILTLTPTSFNTCINWNKAACNEYIRLNTTRKLHNLCQHRLNSINKDSERPNFESFKDLCTIIHEKKLSNSKVEVRISLPPRSLFVLSGCARINWFHQIKRHDVVSRRLAMTFRELSENFKLETLGEDNIGKEILEIANNFINFNIVSNDPL